MDIHRIKRYLCISCKKAHIFQRITEHTYEGPVPDISNCDFSTYSGHRVVGGRLLAKRPPVGWTLLSIHLIENKTMDIESPAGGICDACLQEETLSALAAGGHIRFATEEDLRQGRR